jgi:quinol monooxygenase YgiN
LHPLDFAMLLATISFRVQPHKRAEALCAVDSLVQRMRMVHGCARSRILADTEDQNLFMLASEWNDAAAAEAFLSSREFQIFKGVRILMRDEPFIVLDDVRTRVTRLMRAS